MPGCTLHLQRQLISNADNSHMHKTTKNLSGIHHCTVLAFRYQAQLLTEEIVIQEQQRAVDMLQAASAGIAPTATQSASDAKNTVAAAPSRHRCLFGRSITLRCITEPVAVQWWQASSSTVLLPYDAAHTERGMITIEGKGSHSCRRPAMLAAMLLIRVDINVDALLRF